MPDSFQPVFSALEGEWRLEREYSSGERFFGNAVFSVLGDNRLQLRETGVLHLHNTRSLAANRSWVWTFSPLGLVRVWYDEPTPRLYHSMVPEFSEHGWNGTARHLCGQDHYDGEYRFALNQIIIHHRVKGPAKDYRFAATYQKTGHSNERTGSPESGPREP